MANNRPVQRKVVIVFENRDPNDSKKLLEDIASALRPNHVEIRVTSSVEPTEGVADEQLETAAHHAAERVLDQADEKPGPPVEPKRARKKLLNQVKRLGVAGWQFVAKVIPDSARIAKSAEDIWKLGGELLNSLIS